MQGMTRGFLVLTMVLCWSGMAQAQMGMSGGPGQGGGVPGQGAPARDAGSGADIEGLSEELADNDPMVRLQAVRELAAAAKDEDAIRHLIHATDPGRMPTLHPRSSPFFKSQCQEC